MKYYILAGLTAVYLFVACGIGLYKFDKRSGSSCDIKLGPNNESYFNSVKTDRTLTFYNNSDSTAPEFVTYSFHGRTGMLSGFGFLWVLGLGIYAWLSWARTDEWCGRFIESIVTSPKRGFARPNVNYKEYAQRFRSLTFEFLPSFYVLPSISQFFSLKSVRVISTQLLWLCMIKLTINLLSSHLDISSELFVSGCNKNIRDFAFETGPIGKYFAHFMDLLQQFGLIAIGTPLTGYLQFGRHFKFNYPIYRQEQHTVGNHRYSYPVLVRDSWVHCINHYEPFQSGVYIVLYALLMVQFVVCASILIFRLVSALCFWTEIKFVQKLTKRGSGIELNWKRSLVFALKIGLGNLEFLHDIANKTNFDAATIYFINTFARMEDLPVLKQFDASRFDNV